MAEEKSDREPKCPDCGSKMNFLQNWATKEYDYFMHQCPKCKTVKVEQVDFLRDESVIS